MKSSEKLIVNRLITILVDEICHDEYLSQCEILFETFPQMPSDRTFSLFKMMNFDLEICTNYIFELSSEIEKKCCIRNASSFPSLKCLSYEMCILLGFDMITVMKTIFEQYFAASKLISDKHAKIFKQEINEILDCFNEPKSTDSVTYPKKSKSDKKSLQINFLDDPKVYKQTVISYLNFSIIEI